MTKSTSDAIARAVVAVSIRIENGTLRSRLCFECGDVDGPSHVCDVFPVENKVPGGACKPIDSALQPENPALID